MNRMAGVRTLMPVTTFLFCTPIPPFVIPGMCFDSAVSRLKGEGRRYIS